MCCDRWYGSFIDPISVRTLCMWLAWLTVKNNRTSAQNIWTPKAAVSSLGLWIWESDLFLTQSLFCYIRHIDRYSIKARTKTEQFRKKKSHFSMLNKFALLPWFLFKFHPPQTIWYDRRIRKVVLMPLDIKEFFAVSEQSQSGNTQRVSVLPIWMSSRKARYKYKILYVFQHLLKVDGIVIC